MRHTQNGLMFLICGLLFFSSSTVASAQSVKRQIVVSAVDSNGIPIADLAPSDIIITEDGIRREILSVRRDMEPKQIALLVDTSQAAEPAMQDFKKAAGTFVELIGEGHEVSLISFGGTPRILTEATTVPAQLRDGVGKLFSYSNTASYLLDAVSEIVRGFQRRSAPRPIIVVFATLGVDYSNVDDRGTLDRLRDAGVAMHAIVLAQSPVRGIGPGQGFTQRTGRGLGQTSSQLELDRFLQQGPTQTGGRRRNLHTFTSAEPAVNDLTAQLQNQYLVVYSRPVMLIPPEKIQVTAAREGLDARGTPVIIDSDR
jgi:VWFA-related protein